MDEDFESRAHSELARLLVYWRSTESWLKKAEQVNQNAIIPAINELRYASRQFIVAFSRLQKTELTEIDKKHVDKRLTIAEQYLFNADHDISDAIATYCARAIRDIDTEVGSTALTEFFPEYPLMKRKLEECNELISEARLDYDKRKENYDLMKRDHLLFLINSSKNLEDAEVKAKFQKNKIENDLLRARARIGILEKLTIAGAIAGVFALIAIPLSIYTWIVPKEEYCRLHGETPVIGAVCQH